MDLMNVQGSPVTVDADARRHALELLAAVDTAESVHQLVAALGDSVRGVRAAAFNSLEQLRCPEVYSALVNCLNQKNLVVRNAASLLLINMQLRAVPALVPALKNPDHDVRKFVVDILGLIPDNGEDLSLLPLVHDTDDNVRISVIEALGNMKSQQSVDELIKIYAADENMRVTVCEALGKIGGSACEAFLLSEAQQQRRAAECDDLLLATILDALAQCGSEQSVAFLQELLDEAEVEIQHAAMSALICIHENVIGTTDELRGYVVALTAMLHSNNEAHASAAAKTLAAFPESEALNSLLSVAGHSTALDQILITAIGQRPHGLEEIISLIVNQAASLLAEQLSVLLVVFREHLAIVQQAGAETVEQVFAIFEQLRTLCHDEQRALVDDILMMLDYDRAMMLEETNEGGERL